MSHENGASNKNAKKKKIYEQKQKRCALKEPIMGWRVQDRCGIHGNISGAIWVMIPSPDNPDAQAVGKHLLREPGLISRTYKAQLWRNCSHELNDKMV